MKIGIVDYGAGNIGSVMRSFVEAGVNAVLLDDYYGIRNVDGVVLPGVGRFSDCKKLLDTGSWTSALIDSVYSDERPLLGICLGMQLLADQSHEGDDGPVPGLGIIPGEVVHLRDVGCTGRIPHVGWNSVFSNEFKDPIFDGIFDGIDFYFVHSYTFVAKNPANCIAFTNYGVNLTAVVRNGNVWGAQFHPEKSSRAGLRFIQNFVESSIC